MKRLIEIAGEAATRTAAAMLLLANAPLWLAGTVAKILAGGRVTQIQCWGPSGSFDALAVVGPDGSRKVLWLLNVIGGQMQFIGPEPASSPGSRLSHRPGIASPSRLRRAVGIGHQSDARIDERFFDGATSRQRLTLLLRHALSGLFTVKSSVDISTDAVVELFGVPINAVSMQQAVDQITGVRDRAHEQKTKIVSFVNPDCLNKACSDREYHYLLNRADTVLPDGSGLRIAAKMLGLPLHDNVNGTDLFPLLCQAAEHKGLRLFLFGGSAGIAQAAAEAMQLRFPDLKIVGCLDGFANRDDDARVVQQINASGADIVLVGLGAPLQEKWLDQHRHELNAAVGIGVGGLFDYYSGRIKRAPLWLRESGLEWVWRILQEPSAKWRRYVFGNPLFLMRVLRERQARHSNIVGRQLRETLATPAQFADLTLQSEGSDYDAAWTGRRMWQISLLMRQLTKRALDIFVALGAAVALSPFLLMTTIAIRLESSGPILFRQVRVGLRGETFSMLKFRSMFVDAEERLNTLQRKNESADGVLFKMKQDPRITRVGRFIRRLSIDELPQIFNVLRGDMSIVGPRPALPQEVAQYASSDRKRLQTKPGLTCLWQIGGRSDLSFQQQVQLDIDYLQEQNLLTDLQIIAKTVPAVISGKGAY